MYLSKVEPVRSQQLAISLTPSDFKDVLGSPMRTILL